MPRLWAFFCSFGCLFPGCGQVVGLSLLAQDVGSVSLVGVPVGSEYGVWFDYVGFNVRFCPRELTRTCFSWLRLVFHIIPTTILYSY